jgi:2-oxoacid:acceptor oxidoreductase delta subunit (pyruvate/2-ketoisovalerate family)
LKTKGWKEMPIGGLILDAGNSVEYETGSWRSLRPILDEAKCPHCMICWIYCPEGSISVMDGKVVGFDLDYCKGCGICEKECPRKAITMIRETDAKGAS